MDENTKRLHKRLKSIYNNMISRCHNEKAKDYKYYGEKGVKVCESWRKSFAGFCIWALTNGYEENLTLDRIDPNRNYEPSNCRWADWKTQANNRRKPEKIKNQYGEWDYKQALPEPYKGETENDES